MQIRIARPGYVLAAGLALAMATPPVCAAPLDENASVFPYVADDVVGVASIDLSQIDVKEMVAHLGQLGGWPDDALREAHQITQGVALQMQTFKQLGVEQIHMLLRTSDIEHGGPSWVAPLARDGDAAKVVELVKRVLQDGGLSNHAPFPSAFLAAEGAVLAACNERQLAMLAASRRQPSAIRGEAQAALNRVGRHAVGLVVFGDADSRRVIRETSLQFPPPFGDLDGSLIADGLQWGGITVDFVPQLRIAADLEARDASAAKRVHQLSTQVVELLRASLENQAALAPQDASSELVRAAGLLRPRVEGTRVSLSFGDDADEVAAIGEHLARPLRAARESARRSQRINQFKQIAVAMHNYASAKKSTFPPQAIVDGEGRPLLSWRVALLPYLEKDDLYQQFRLDEPWDSEHNRRLIGQMPEVFADPDPGIRRALGGERTTFVVPTGERTVFRGAVGMQLKDITDGTSVTILAVEVVPERAVIWTQPSDWEVDFTDPLRGVRRTDNRSFTACRCDGSVHSIDNSIDAGLWQKLLTPDGGEVIER